MTMRYALIAVMAALTLAGCAGLQAQEAGSAARALTDAGFEVRPADTPEKLAHLQSLPAHKVLAREQDGQRQYVYADPTTCRCLYVGGEDQYRQLRAQQQAAVDRFFAVERTGDAADFGAWQVWGR
jgi:hypothetical protein